MAIPAQRNLSLNRGDTSTKTTIYSYTLLLRFMVRTSSRQVQSHSAVPMLIAC